MFPLGRHWTVLGMAGKATLIASARRCLDRQHWRMSSLQLSRENFPRIGSVDEDSPSFRTLLTHEFRVFRTAKKDDLHLKSGIVKAKGYFPPIVQPGIWYEDTAGVGSTLLATEG